MRLLLLLFALGLTTSMPACIGLPSEPASMYPVATMMRTLLQVEFLVGDVTSDDITDCWMMRVSLSERQEAKNWLEDRSLMYVVDRTNRLKLSRCKETILVPIFNAQSIPIVIDLVFDPVRIACPFFFSVLNDFQAW